MRTAQAAEILGFTVSQLMSLRRDHEIAVPKDGDRYVWTEAHLEEVRAALRQRETRRQEAVRHGLTAREAAAKLGIAYEDLLGIIHQQGIAVPRTAPNRYYAFDEASLDLVRKALKNEAEPPPWSSGLTTKEVAAALGGRWLSR